MKGPNADADYVISPEAMTKMLRCRDDLMAEIGDPGPILAEEVTERGYTWWTPTRVYGAKPWKREIRSMPRNPPVTRSDESGRASETPSPPLPTRGT